MKLTSLILNLKLRVKLLLAFGSVLLLSGLLMVKSFTTIRTANNYQQANEVIDSLNIYLLEADRAMQHFIYEGFKSSDFQMHGKSNIISTVANSLQGTRDKALKITKRDFVVDDSVSLLLSHLTDLEEHFASIISLFRQRGFKDFGLEGQLREAIHAVEASNYSYDKADMLMLRRHEKDFFLRRDTKYADEFNKRTNSFYQELLEAKASLDRDGILKQLEVYRSLFNQVVDIDVKIGLQERDGFKSLLTHDITNLKNITQNLRLAIKEHDAEFQASAWLLLIIMFVVQLAAGIVLAVFYSGQITRAVKELQRAMQSFAKGTFPSKLQVRSNEEIGKTKRAFNQLLDRIKAAQEFSVALGEGRLNVEYSSEFSEDMLAQSMIKMQHQLKEAMEKQRIINWSNQGMAKLNEILKTENEEIEVLGDQIIKTLVKYLNANQGAIYLVREGKGEKCAERISTYAYGKKKFVEHRVEFGDGLVGQCLLEKATILITQVPTGYVKITSGLGEATPRFILIAPLLVNDSVMGVIEIASFEEMPKYQVEFLERISGNIASILLSKKISLETASLLEDSRAHARQLAQQEEVVCQNTEEMRAITEQLEREKQQLQEEIIQLKSLLNISETESVLQK
jgi:HAMP domain-containing protein